MPNDMWILAFVIVPLFVIAAALIIGAVSERAARKHREESRHPPLYHQ